MSNLVLFTPRRTLDAEENVQAFIALCRSQLTIFGVDLPFDRIEWDISAAVVLKAKRNRTCAVFSTWESSTAANPVAMPEPYCSFAKAYFRYQHGYRPTKSFGGRIAALRALGGAWAERGGSSISETLDSGTFNRAAQLIKGRFTPAVAYRVAGQLELVAEFVDTNSLVAFPLQWRHSLSRPGDRNKVGKEFDDERQSKLPSPAALDALARAYRAAESPREIIGTAVAAILCSAPDRVNEVLRLPEACEIRRERGDAGIEYGLRFWPSKGADPMIKWLIPSMASVVIEAVASLRKCTAAAREVAAWYESNPGKLFLSTDFEDYRAREFIGLEELQGILFEGDEVRNASISWCRQYKVPVVTRNGKSSVRFADVEATILTLLPRGFPIMDPETGLRYSDALCVIRRFELNEQKRTYRGIVSMVSQADISDVLGGRTAHGVQSIFDRLGFSEVDGSPIRVRSHQFRHYLNTLAQAGGMSQLDLAKWSGRKDMLQNDAYDHVSDRDKLALLADLRGGMESGQSLPDLRHVKLISRAQFAELQAASAHTSDYGYCLHDFAMAPCQLHMDCLNCNELVCIKGDGAREANIRLTRAETRTLLEEAQAAEVGQVYGANRWVEHQSKTLARLDQLCGIFDDPSVPKGAVIRLAPAEQASRLQQPVYVHAESTLSVGEGKTRMVLGEKET